MDCDRAVWLSGEGTTLPLFEDIELAFIIRIESGKKQIRQAVARDISPFIPEDITLEH
jgi:hypothetical protein